MEAKDKIMKTHAVLHKKHNRATATAKAAPSKPERQPKRTVAKVLAPKNGTTARPVLLLLERFPAPDKSRVCLELYAPDAQVVFVAGSFNDWQPGAMPLQKREGDRWAVELTLDPGRYEYRFVVDGRWTDDPLSPAYVSNPFDGLNCVLVAAEPV
jgi:1,4-alpha-glucan branching enzyme